MTVLTSVSDHTYYLCIFCLDPPSHPWKRKVWVIDLEPQHILIEKLRLEASLHSLQAGLQHGCWRNDSYAASFRKDMGLFQDYGWITEAFELCEELLVLAVDRDEFTTDATLLLAQTFVAHMDISRGRRVADHQAFFTRMLAHADDLLHGHACLGLGVLMIHQGLAEKALDFFQRGQLLFEAADHPLYAIKMRVLEIMALRIMEEHEKAFPLSLNCLQDAKRLMPRTAAPLLLLLSVVAGHHTRIGKRFEAQRYSWEAVRLANSLPPSKAGGFAYFQHARGLHALGRLREATIWCTKAEPILKVFDPFARISNLILLFQCFKDQQQWNKAEAMLERILDAPMVECIWEDLAELLADGIRFFLEIFAVDKARRMLAYLTESAERFARNFSEAKNLLDAMQTLISARELSLQNAKRVGHGSKIVYIDRKERRLLLRHAGQIVQKNLTRAPGSFVILDLLHESLQRREPIVPRQRFLECWMQRQVQGKALADPGKTLRRNLTALEELGVVETEGQGKAQGLCFPSNITVYFIDDSSIYS